MKIRSAFFVFMLMAASCGLSEIDGGNPQEGGGIWGGPIAGPGDSVADQICYMTVVDYAKGYDWRSDMASESVRCSLVVYVDGSAVMKVPVGQSRQVSSDADMHRVVGGNLYTDYPEDSRTIVKKNSQYLFSYEGAERVCNLIVSGEDVYTLGESRLGTGFSFRRNGEPVLTRTNGYLTAPLRHDGDSLCFGFCEQIRSAEGPVDRYYCVYGSKVTNLSLREDLRAVWDVFTSSGEPVCLVLLHGLSQPVIIHGENMLALNIPKGLTMISGSMFCAGDRIGVEGVCRTATGGLKSGIWVDGKQQVLFDNANISAVFADGDGICCVLNPMNSASEGMIYRCGEIFKMPKGYSCVGVNGLSMINGILHVGLSSLAGERPIVWKDGQLDTLSVNGYISSITAR